MVEKILPYDRTIVPQETGYWCGPASVQVVLNSLGIRVSEPDMARELRTHTGGTDWIGQFPAVLNRHTNAGYFVVEMPNDPPRAEQKERLWRDIVASINGGRGVIANIVAPPSNYPRGVKGSTSPAYRGGTVYHYFSVMGYDDAGARAVWIADSGFQPQGYWMSFDQLASLIPPKGYAAAPGPATPAPAPKPAPEHAGLTAETLSEAMGGTVPLDRYRQLLPAFSNAMVQAGCTTVERAAMWCAQLGHESKGLSLFRELWGPTEDQLTYDGRMGNGPGEGFKYRGRGAIQVTGRNNYRAFSQWAHEHGHVPSPTFFVDQPDQLESDRYALLGAVWYWTTQRPLNNLADARDIVAATKAINGGTNGLADRQLRYQRCLALGTRLLPRTATEELTMADIERLERFIEDFIVGYVGPGLSDLKDMREQLTGSRNLVRREDGSVDLEASFPGWPQLGGDTVVDALGIVLQNQNRIFERLAALENSKAGA
ncbi:C39 family peptidase [Rhodococcus gordoniae]|uniref:C39 family peptidase n=1 Tax=Rhodococcus gordoniae TaxID=223392 RepID=UPI00352634E1